MGFRKGRSFHEAARRPARRVKASVRSGGAPQRPARGRETTPDKLPRQRKRPSERGGNHPRGRFPPLLRNQRRISPTATGPPSGRCPPDNGLVAPPYCKRIPGTRVLHRPLMRQAAKASFTDPRSSAAIIIVSAIRFRVPDLRKTSELPNTRHDKPKRNRGKKNRRSFDSSEFFYILQSENSQLRPCNS